MVVTCRRQAAVVEFPQHSQFTNKNLKQKSHGPTWPFDLVAHLSSLVQHIE